MNRVILIGRIANDLDLKENTKGIKQVKFTLAVNKPKEGADFISCVAWNKTAELICNYLKKGNQLALEGHIQTGSYEAQDGTKRYTTDVIVDNITFTGGKEESKEEKKPEPKVEKKEKDIFEEFGESFKDVELPF